jgi:hypothetical protein
MTQLNCIMCKKDLENFAIDGRGIQPISGSEFNTSGHYGSAITDHMDGTITSVCICDNCLTLNMEYVYVIPPMWKEW